MISRYAHDAARDAMYSCEAQIRGRAVRQNALAQACGIDHSSAQS